MRGVPSSPDHQPRPDRHPARRRTWRNRTTIAVTALLAAAVPVVGSSPADAQEVVCRTRTFNYTGTLQSFVVPSDVTAVIVDAWGAQGGSWGAEGGLGGSVRATLPVTPGEVLTVKVGQAGAYNAGPFGGTFGGGGGSAANAAQGGGASDVRQGGSALSNRVVVAGGGGGVGGGEIRAAGGAGGHPTGGKGANSPDGTGDEGGYGGTQTAGGSRGIAGSSWIGTAATNGSLGQGGNGGSGQGNWRVYYGGGGGGGGYYGGGGGKGGSGYLSPTSYADGAGGGGGSSFGPPSATFLTGVRAGHGQVVVTELGPDCLLPDPFPQYWSDACDAGTNLVAGFFGGQYVKVRTAEHPFTGATMVCVAADDRVDSHLGGRIDVGDGAGDPPTTDADDEACQADANNTTVVSGTVLGGQPVRVDVTAGAGGSDTTTWVCVRVAGAVRLRLIFEGPSVASTAALVDNANPHPFYTEEPWPVVGQPSATCAAATGGDRTSLVNARVGEAWFGLVHAQPGVPGDDAAWVCYRAQSGTEGEGGRLVAGAPTVGTDGTGCAWDVLAFTHPVEAGLYLSWDATGALPAEQKVCVITTGFPTTATVAADSQASFEQDTA